MKIIANISTEICPDILQCSFDEYQFNMDKHYDSIYFTLELSFAHIFTESIETSPSYDVQNLIAEVGGNASLFLGVSGMGISGIGIFIVTIFLKCLKISDSWKGLLFERACKSLVKLAMWLAFVFWAAQAVLNYNDEPLSMNSIQTSKNNLKYFPLLTLCPEFSMTLAYGGLTQYYNIMEPKFFPALERFISITHNESILDESISLLNETLFYDINDLVDKVSIYSAGRITEVTGEYIWSSVYHQTYGLCYTLDAIKGEKDIGTLDFPITVSFKFRIDSGDILGEGGFGWFYKFFDGYLLIHDDNSLPSADLHSQRLLFSPYCATGELPTNICAQFFVTQKVAKSESTKNKPCGELFPRECEDVMVNQMMAERYGCKIPFFQTGCNNHTNFY